MAATGIPIISDRNVRFRVGETSAGGTDRGETTGEPSGRGSGGLPQSTPDPTNGESTPATISNSPRNSIQRCDRFMTVDGFPCPGEREA